MGGAAWWEATTTLRSARLCFNIASKVASEQAHCSKSTSSRINPQCASTGTIDASLTA